MPQSIVMPITNVLAKGDFTVELLVGNPQQSVNLILDTGSSTLVAKHTAYQAHDDNSMQATSYCQDVMYGIGGWYGAVVTTQIEMKTQQHHLSLENVNIAVTAEETPNSFAQADGFWGLAYHQLNKAYDLTDYLQAQNVSPSTTYPWHLKHQSSIPDFGKLIRHYPEHDITPYFTELAQHGVVADQFAFVIHRSSVYQTKLRRSTAALKQHPLNNGLFVLGAPEQQQHLFQRTQHPIALQVVHDKYYNVHLNSIQVGTNTPIEAPALDSRHIKAYVSNAIVDTGASMLALPETLFKQVMSELMAYNPTFKQALSGYQDFLGKEVGIPINEVNLNEWPDLTFYFNGINQQTVKLTMSPYTYWQTHAPEPNQIAFQLTFLPNWPNQTIFGLPFLNNFYTVFDRKDNANGTVKCYPKTFTPHCLEDEQHADTEKMHHIFKANHHAI